MFSPPVSPVSRSISQVQRDLWYYHPNYSQRMRNRRRLSSRTYPHNLSIEQINSIINELIIGDNLV